LPLADQLLREAVQLYEEIRGVEQPFLPIESEPTHVGLDRIDVLDLLGGRIGVVEAQVAQAAEAPREPEVEADRLGVPDVEVAVGFGRKARVDAASVLAAGDVVAHSLFDEMQRGRTGVPVGVRGARARFVHGVHSRSRAL
jgi:hypothetical protein